MSSMINVYSTDLKTWKLVVDGEERELTSEEFLAFVSELEE
jgi:hypothetical protein